MALVDTGCAQTLVQSQYVHRDTWTGKKVSVCCVHGDQSDIPMTEVYIEVSEQPFLMKVGVVANLPYPVLLDMDVPILTEFLQKTALCTAVTRAQTKSVTKVRQTQDTELDTLRELPFADVDVEADKKCEVSQRMLKHRNEVTDLTKASQQINVELEEPEDIELSFNISNELARMQRDDVTLAECFDKVGKETAIDLLNGERFLIENDLLYRQSKEDGTQLVVPEKYCNEVLQLGRSIAWSGHLGFMKTLRIAKRFF